MLPNRATATRKIAAEPLAKTRLANKAYVDDRRGSPGQAVPGVERQAERTADEPSVDFGVAESAVGAGLGEPVQQGGEAR